MSSALLFALWGCPRQAGPAPKPRPGAQKLACDRPIPLRPGAPFQGNTLSGDDDRRASCVRGSAPECVFTLEVSQRSELRLSLESSDFDGSLSLFDAAGGPAAPRELRCIDDSPQGDFHHARLEVTLAAGSYQVMVDGSNGQAGEFELFAELEPLPSPQELCGAARPLSPGVALRESTRGGSNAFSASCGGGAQGPDHVHRVDVAVPSRVRVRQLAEYDGSLYLRTQCEDASSEQVCNDDFQSSGRSQIAARLPRGSYYVFSDSYSREQSGDYVLELERIDEPPAIDAAQACAQARARERTSALRGQHELDTFHEPSLFAGSCGGEGAPEWVLPLRMEQPGILSARLLDAELNAVLYLRRSCAEAHSELACHPAPRVDRPPSEQELSSPGLILPLDRGSYTLVVDGLEPTDIGAATLEIAISP